MVLVCIHGYGKILKLCFQGKVEYRKEKKKKKKVGKQCVGNKDTKNWSFFFLAMMKIGNQRLLAKENREDMKVLAKENREWMRRKEKRNKL